MKKQIVKNFIICILTFALLLFNCSTVCAFVAPSSYNAYVKALSYIKILSCVVIALIILFIIIIKKHKKSNSKIIKYIKIINIILIAISLVVLIYEIGNYCVNHNNYNDYLEFKNGPKFLMNNINL